MSDRAPYSRVYWSVMDDPKFDGIRENPRHIGAWTLLLIVADMAWPAPAFRPPTVPVTSFRILTNAGLVDTLTGGRFRIHGLDAERGRRSDAGRVGGLASGRSRTGDQTGNDGSQPLTSRSPDQRTKSNLDETRRDETSKDEDEKSRAEPDAREDALSTYWILMGNYPNGRTKTWIEELVNEFDDERVGAAIAAEAPGERQGLLGRVRDRLRFEADKAEKARAAAADARLAAEAAAKRITPEQAAENQRRIREELTKMVGPATTR